MIELYHDQKRNLLVYKGPSNERILRTVEDARQVNGEFVALPRTLYNCQLLQWIDLPVPPIMDGYDWPHNINALPRMPDGSLAKVPTDAQRCMANFLVLHPRCFNLSDMGTMKTLAACWAADFIMDQYPPGECRAYIVAPLNVLQRVWADALFNHFLRRRTFTIVHASRAKDREKQLAEKSDFYIINYDGLTVGANTRRGFKLGGLSKILSERTDVRMAIVDECRAYADRRTDRHDAARLILKPKDYLWMITGTPTPNAPTDAYGQAKLVNDAYGEGFNSFKRRTMVQLSEFKWLPARGGYQAAAKLLQPAVRFSIEEVWDGPPMTMQPREVELTATQRNMLSDLKKKQAIILKDKPMILPNAAVIRTKALQILMGAVYDGDHVPHRTEAKHRIKALIDVIEEAHKKILVFVPLTSVIDLLYEELTKAGHGCIKLNGSVPIKARAEAIAQFSDVPAVRVALADPTVVAHGINEFVAATTVCWYGPTDKTELYIQGNKRVHRPGQNWPVTGVQLVASMLEREIFKRIATNEKLEDVMLKWVQGDQI